MRKGSRGQKKQETLKGSFPLDQKKLPVPLRGGAPRLTFSLLQLRSVGPERGVITFKPLIARLLEVVVDLKELEGKRRRKGDRN